MSVLVCFVFWGFFEGFGLVFDLSSPCLLISNKLRTAFYFFSDTLLISQHTLTSPVPAPSPPFERPLGAPAFPLDPKLRRINPKSGSFRPARGKPPPAARHPQGPPAAASPGARPRFTGTARTAATPSPPAAPPGAPLPLREATQAGGGQSGQGGQSRPSAGSAEPVGAADSRAPR